ncbi:MAG: hypothetical protein WCF18_18845 [Chthoniobacteraceae bacterium]
MKSTFLLIASASAAFGASAVESAIPSVFPAERYEAMIAKSPFALATPPAPVAAPPEKNFADGWYVSGLAQLDGKDFVTIKSRDLAVQLSLFGTDPRDGIALQKVEWSPALGKSTVTIVKDGQTAKLEFNQAEMQSPASAPAPPSMAPGTARSQAVNPPMVRPAVPRPPQPVIQPQQYGGLPNVNPTIPRPNGGVGGVVAPTPDTRRRIRVINNVPSQ